jgi:hypothetical protein
MSFSYPDPLPLRLVLIFLLLAATTARAQEVPTKGNDSVLISPTLKIKLSKDSLSSAVKEKFNNSSDTIPKIARQKLRDTKETISNLSDTLQKLPDTLIRGSLQWLEEQKKLTQEKFRSTTNAIITTPTGLKMKKREFLNDLSNQTYANLFDTKPLVKFSGGYVSYQFDYRSNIDTPYIEKDLAQHNTTGHLNFLLGSILPLRVTFWTRQSNSSLFRDITSVNMSFDAGAFRNQLQDEPRRVAD